MSATMQKTVVITWSDDRSWHPGYGTPMAALWVANGIDRDVNDALRYLHRYRPTGRVHTFATDDTDWEAKAKAAHGRGDMNA